MNQTRFQRDSTIAQKLISAPLTTAISLTKRPFYLIKPSFPGLVAGLDVACRTLAGSVTVQAYISHAAGMVTAPGLAIDAVPEKYKLTNAFLYRVGDGVFNKAAATAIAFTAAHVVAASKWGAILVEINAAGTPASIVPAATATTAMTFNNRTAAVSAVLALANTANKVSVGYILINAKVAGWTAQTDDMTNGSDVVTAEFIDLTSADLSANLLAASITPVAGSVVQATIAAAFRSKYFRSTALIVLTQTTDGTGALTDAVATLRIRPFPLEGEARVG